MEEHFHSDCSAENHYEGFKFWLLAGFGRGFRADFRPYEDAL